VGVKYMNEDAGSRKDKVAQRHIAEAAINLSCEAYGITKDELLAPSRSQAHISLARQVAMYLAHVVGQLSLVQLSSEFNRDRTTVSHACHMIEDRRDSPIFERQMAFLEKEYKLQVKNIHRNWLANSEYYRADDDDNDQDLYQSSA